MDMLNYYQWEFDNPINRFGCYFCCLCFLLNKMKEEVEPFFDECAQNGWLNPLNAYIKNPCAILGIPEADSYRPKKYTPKPFEVEIYKFILPNNAASHFVVGDSTNFPWIMAQKHVLYDPMGKESIINKMVLDSRRVFKMPKFDYKNIF